MPFPKSITELVEQGYKFLNDGRCSGKSCGAPLEFWRTPKGKTMPLDKVTYEPHWATCPDREDFKRAKAPAPARR